MVVTVDLDGTLLPGRTAFQVVLSAAGRGEEVEESDRRFHAGQQTLQDTFWEQWPWVQELSLQEMHRHLRRSDAWLPGIGEGIRSLDAEARILTDQPACLAEFGGRWGFAPPLASPVEVRDGRVVGIEARFDKLANLRRHCEAMGIPLSRVCHVGNGANDVPVFEAVGASVAVFAEPDVAAAADVDLGRVDSFAPVAEVVRRLAR